MGNESKIAVVLGPFSDYVEIHYFTEDLKSDGVKVLDFNKYQEEYSRGLHRYIDPRNHPSSLEASSLDYKKILKPLRPLSYFQKIKKQKQKFRNKRKKYFKLSKRLDRQVVIKIKNTDSVFEYYYIVDLFRDKRDHRLVKIADSKLHSWTDDNGILRFRVVYDIEKSCRIRPVVGYKKFFWITDTGLLISRRNKRELTKNLTKKGYQTHITRIGGRKGINVCFRIHRLVGEAFIPNPDNKPFINHIDAVKTNNHHTNLEWVTNKENIDHAVTKGLFVTKAGMDNNQVKLTHDTIREIFRLRNDKLKSHGKIASIVGISKTTVTRVLNQKIYKKRSCKN